MYLDRPKGETALQKRKGLIFQALNAQPWQIKIQCHPGYKQLRSPTCVRKAFRDRQTGAGELCASYNPASPAPNKRPSVQNTRPSQECDLENAPPCPYKWNSSQKEIRTVNVMCFTTCLSMAQWVDIIAFSKVEKQEGCEGTCCGISAPLHLWQHTTINTHIPPTFFLQKTHAGEPRGCGDCFCWLLYLCCWYKESETERLCFKSAALLST